jgi:hypothetical protein
MTVSDTFNQFQDATLSNPFLRAQQRTGWHFMYEPFFFWNPTGPMRCRSGRWVSRTEGRIPS